MQRGLKKGDNEQKKSPPQQERYGGLLKENGGDLLSHCYAVPSA